MSVKLRGIMVAVDYTDILRITLPYNRPQFSEMYIVTSVADAKNVYSLAEEHKCQVIITDLFYHGGAVFNKWAALEYGIHCMGRIGWLCIMDADVCWPRGASLEMARYLTRGNLYTPRRRMCDPVPDKVPGECTWCQYPIHPQEKEFAGYSQIFHAEDPHLGDPPWHQTNWKHSGGADSFFQAKWPEECKVRPSFQVLHLGPAGVNWCGRSTPYTDGTRHPLGEERYQQVRGFIKGRHSQTGMDRFAHEKL